MNSITASQTTINIGDATAVPDAPNLCTIGFGENMETIKYATKIDGALSGITRGIEGTPQAWGAGTEVARFFTAYDHEAIIDTVTTHLADSANQGNPHGIDSKADKILESGIELTFKNNWVRGDGTVPPQFYKDSFGVVRLAGSVQNGNINTVISTLPSGYRPAADLYFIVTGFKAFGRVKVSLNGDIILDHIEGNNTLDNLVHLTGINFRTD